MEVEYTNFANWGLFRSAERNLLADIVVPFPKRRGPNDRKPALRIAESNDDTFSRELLGKAGRAWLHGHVFDTRLACNRQHGRSQSPAVRENKRKRALGERNWRLGE